MQFSILPTILCLCIIGLFYAPVYAVEREYFIAAEEAQWDYAPSGRDGLTGMEFNTSVSDMDMQHGMSADHEAGTWTLQSSNRIGTVYKKVFYREYTDSSFSVPKNRSDQWAHLGYLGPVIHASVGDSIRIVFKNNALSGNRSYSMHPHGVFYSKENEGMAQSDKLMQIPTRLSNLTMNHTNGDTHDMNSNHNITIRNGNAVPPGGNYTYVWKVPERSGPGPSDPSSIVWLYHSHVDEIRDTNSGLVGAIVVSRDSAPLPKDVDREFVTLFTIVDENLSWYFDENIRAALPQLSDSEIAALKIDEDFQMSNQKHAMNGYIYANLESLEMNLGDRVRWHAISLGDEKDLHAIHWHGQTVLDGGHRTDVLELMPASAKSVDMVADNPGIWLYHCHTNHHMMAGMYANFYVYELPNGGMDGHLMADAAPWKYAMIFTSMGVLTALSIFVGYKLL